jgi:uncharacterized delta-60 repeat protein
MQEHDMSTIATKNGTTIIALLSAAYMLLCPVRLPGAADKGGQLDSSFSFPDRAFAPVIPRPRIILTDVGKGTFEAAYAMAVQPDGKIVAVGFSTPAVGPSSDFALVRYESTGRIDRSFGDNGRVLTDFSGTGSTDQAFAVAIDSGGKIVVAGYSSSAAGVDFAVARYNSDGTLDTSFNSTGKVLTNFGGVDTATAVAIDSDHRIVVAGSSNAGGNHLTYDFAVARYDSDGMLDETFNKTGLVLTDFGKGSGDFATSAVIQSDGNIVVGGLSDASGMSYDFALARYNGGNGSLDRKVLTDFSGSGSIDRLEALAIQSDGNIVAVGDSIGLSIAEGRPTFAVARYKVEKNGTLGLDTAFNATGKVFTGFESGNATAQAVAIQSDGRIVVAGWLDDGNREGPDFALARYNTDGTPDLTFNSTAEVVSNVVVTNVGGFDVAYGVGIQPDGKIVAAGFSDVRGTSDFALVLYLP